jgi:hypothetical protein
VKKHFQKGSEKGGPTHLSFSVGEKYAQTTKELTNFLHVSKEITKSPKGT